MGAVACAKGGPQPPVRPRSTSHLPPRKVIVGTVMQSFWEAHPGLEKRLDQLAAIVDRMSEESKSKYGGGFGLALLPETGVKGGAGGGAASVFRPFDGGGGQTIAGEAR